MGALLRAANAPLLTNSTTNIPAMSMVRVPAAPLLGLPAYCLLRFDASNPLRTRGATAEGGASGGRGCARRRSPACRR